jgi:hypothetical protein
MWKVLFVVGSVNMHRLTPLRVSIPPWVYSLALQVALLALAFAATWWLACLKKEMVETARELRRLAEEVRSRGAK